MESIVGQAKYQLRDTWWHLSFYACPAVEKHDSGPSVSILALKLTQALFLNSDVLRLPITKLIPLLKRA